jgi:hypothetical protein
MKAKASHFHFAMAGVWALLAIPTLLIWKDSILWVATMSLYANLIGHVSSAQAARSEEAEED